MVIWASQGELQAHFRFKSFYVVMVCAGMGWTRGSTDWACQARVQSVQDLVSQQALPNRRPWY